MNYLCYCVMYKVMSMLGEQYRLYGSPGKDSHKQVSDDRGIASGSICDVIVSMLFLKWAEVWLQISAYIEQPFYKF